MQFRVASAVLVAVASAQVIDDSPSDAPQDAPQEVPDTFGDWCRVASDCVQVPAAFGSDVQCIRGACVCSGAYVDPSASQGSEYTGWICVPIGQPIPSIELTYRVEWTDQTANCNDRPADFDAKLRSEFIEFFGLTDFTFSEAYCGSIHFGITGKTTVGGRTGFASRFAADSSNPFGAPTVFGQKTSLTTCQAVSPIATAATVGSLCQPLSCIQGFNLRSSGSLNVLSTCTATPVPTTLAPSQTTAPAVSTSTSDDDLSIGAILGIVFGVSFFIVIVVLVILFFVRRSTQIDSIEQEQSTEKENNPDHPVDSAV